MKKQKLRKFWFTFVELIVSVVIITLLSTIWFYSYVWYLSEARDGERKADSGWLRSALKLYKQKRWAYPIPWDYFSIANSWAVVANQWKMNLKVSLNTMNVLPYDPYTKQPYVYSVTNNKQEFQIAITLENGDFPLALVEWDYQSVSKYVLPSIVLAISSTNAIEIHDWIWQWSVNRNKFIVNSWKNLPYELNAPYEPYYAWGDIDDVLDSWEPSFWQNIDYKDCAEIYESGKSIWDWEYQVLSWATSTLETVTCNF